MLDTAIQSLWFSSRVVTASSIGDAPVCLTFSNDGIFQSVNEKSASAAGESTNRRFFNHRLKNL